GSAQPAAPPAARSLVLTWPDPRPEVPTRATVATTAVGPSPHVPAPYLHHRPGSVRLPSLTRNFPWARARDPVHEPGAGRPPARFDERRVKAEHGGAREIPATERVGHSLGPSTATASPFHATQLKGPLSGRDLRPLELRARARRTASASPIPSASVQPFDPLAVQAEHAVEPAQLHALDRGVETCQALHHRHVRPDLGVD